MLGSKCTIPTPDLSHAAPGDWDFVYEPAEDSFLLIDAIEEDLDFIRQKNPLVCLEVGSGSGVVITALASQVASASCFAIDMNLAACRLTQRTAKANKMAVEVVQGNLLSSLKPSSLDLVLFNPPYVVTPEEEIVEGAILNRAWAGGKNGRTIIDMFLAEVVYTLRTGGIGYLLLLKENRPEEVAEILQLHGCRTEQIKERKLRGEFLVVLRFEKISNVVIGS